MTPRNAFNIMQLKLHTMYRTAYWCMHTKYRLPVLLIKTLNIKHLQIGTISAKYIWIWVKKAKTIINAPA